MSRRRKDPDALTLIRFIADHESLSLTAEEFPDITEERVRDILRAFLLELSQTPPKRQPQATQAPAQGQGQGQGQGQLALPASPDGKPAPKPSASASKRPPRAAGTHVVVHTDGASRGNPGPAGAGWVISGSEGEVVSKGGAFLGRRTNNEAEYEAVIRALNAAADLGANEVSLRSDSELLVKQINGTYRVKEERLMALYHQAREALQRFRRFDVKHVPREANSAADAQANQAIDGSNVAVG